MKLYLIIAAMFLCNPYNHQVHLFKTAPINFLKSKQSQCYLQRPTKVIHNTVEIVSPKLLLCSELIYNKDKRDTIVLQFFIWSAILRYYLQKAKQ